MDLVDHLLELYQRTHAQERRISSMMRPGTVAEVDPAARTVRLRISPEGEEAFLSPPIPYGQIAGPGTGLKVHHPPTVGQNMTLFAPTGDLRQSVAVPMTWSDQAPSPGATADPVMTYGMVKVEVGLSNMKVTVGEAVIDIATTGITVEFGGKGFKIDPVALQMTHQFRAKDMIGQPAHYVTGLDTGGDKALDGQATVML
jgi:phage baseplate assembly protein gpV